MTNDTPKNTITEADVEYTAKLARLNLNQSEVKTIQKQLSNILGYIDQLNEVNVRNTTPLTHVTIACGTVLREDSVRAGLSPDEALKNAPDREGNFFKVPKIIKDS